MECKKSRKLHNFAINVEKHLFWDVFLLLFAFLLLPNLTLDVLLYAFGLSLKARLCLALSSIWQFWIIFSCPRGKVKIASNFHFAESQFLFQTARQTQIYPLSWQRHPKIGIYLIWLYKSQEKKQYIFLTSIWTFLTFVV